MVSEIWVAVINNLEENHHTFLLLKHLAQEGDVSFTLHASVLYCRNSKQKSLTHGSNFLSFFLSFKFHVAVPTIPLLKVI